MPTKNIDDLTPPAAAVFKKAQADPDLKNKPFQILCVLRSLLEQEARLPAIAISRIPLGQQAM